MRGAGVEFSVEVGLLDRTTLGSSPGRGYLISYPLHLLVKKIKLTVIVRKFSTTVVVSVEIFTWLAALLSI
jgi:hypothetical protein